MLELLGGFAELLLTFLYVAINIYDQMHRNH